MDVPASSLQQIYRRRLDVPMLIVAAMGVLALGLYLPILHVRRLLFFEGEYSVITGLREMMREGDHALAGIIFFFSVVFPSAKLLMLMVVWLMPQTPRRRLFTLHWLGVLGKWSMLDVFVVAIIVVISRGGRWLNATPLTGLYVFAAAISMSMLLTMYVHHLATKVDVPVRNAPE